MSGEAEVRWPSPRIATMFSVGPSGGSPIIQRWQVKPSGFSAASSTSKTSPLAGVHARTVDQLARKRDWVDGH